MSNQLIDILKVPDLVEFTAPPPDLPEDKLKGLIQDIVLKTAPRADIFRAYEITEYQFQQLEQTADYQKTYKDVVSFVQSLGHNAAFILKSRALLEDQLADLGKMIGDGRIDPLARIQIAKEFVKWGQLYEEKAKDKSGPALVVNFDFGAATPPMKTVNP